MKARTLDRERPSSDCATFEIDSEIRHQHLSRRGLLPVSDLETSCT